MITHVTRSETIATVATKPKIPQGQLPLMTQEQENLLAEFITVLREVRRVARELEADKKVSMSCAPRLIRELYETLLILACGMLPDSVLFIPGGEHVTIEDVDVSTGHRVIESISDCDDARDDIRTNRLAQDSAKSFARAIADRIYSRLGSLWQQVNAHTALRKPDTANENQSDKDEAQN